MSTLSGFLAQNVLEVENEKHVISKRFIGEDGKPIPWEIRALGEKENEELKRSCTQLIKSRNTSVYKTDYDLYLAKLVVESVVFPNLRDAELQKSYGVLGAEELVKKMLIVGEYSKLVEVVQKVCGLDENMEDLIDEAKN